MNSQQFYNAIQRSPGSSNWLKSAAAEAMTRDCVDMLADAETLVEFCETICREAGVQS